jgi:hypothetical protein
MPFKKPYNLSPVHMRHKRIIPARFMVCIWNKQKQKNQYNKNKEHSISPFNLYNITIVL